MQRYHIEYDRFMQMFDDVEFAIESLKNGNNHTALNFLENCMVMMKTEKDFHGKNMPIDDFKESQRLTA